MASYRISRDAQLDIQEIQDYIAKWNPLNAIRFADKIRDTIRILADAPHIGRKRDDLMTGLRTHPLGNYSIFYRPFREYIEVVRVISARRDIESLF
jgi:toxin ParE1/3/4